MQFSLKGAALVVADIEKSKKFYSRVFDIKTVDVEDYTILVIEPESRFVLRSEKSVREQIGVSTEKKGGAVISLIAENFDKFDQRLKECDVEYVHTAKELPTRQRVVRFYDPDKYIIEVLEDYAEVCDRLIKCGESVKDIAKWLDLSEKFVLKRKQNLDI